MTDYYLAPETQKTITGSIPEWLRRSNNGETLSVVPNYANALLNIFPSGKSLEFDGAPGAVSYVEFTVDSAGDASVDLRWAFDIDPNVGVDVSVDGASKFSANQAVPNDQHLTDLTFALNSSAERPGGFAPDATIDFEDSSIPAFLRTSGSVWGGYSTQDWGTGGTGNQCALLYVTRTGEVASVELDVVAPDAGAEIDLLLSWGLNTDGIGRILIDGVEQESHTGADGLNGSYTLHALPVTAGLHTVRVEVTGGDSGGQNLATIDSIHVVGGTPDGYSPGWNAAQSVDALGTAGQHVVRISLDTTAADPGALAQVFFDQVTAHGTTPSGDVGGEMTSDGKPVLETDARSFATATLTAVGRNNGPTTGRVDANVVVQASVEVEVPPRPILEATGTVGAVVGLSNGGRPPYNGIGSDVTPDPLDEAPYASLQLDYLGGGDTNVTISFVLTTPSAENGDTELQFFTIDSEYGAAFILAFAATTGLLSLTDISGQPIALLDAPLGWGQGYRLALQVQGGSPETSALAWQVYDYAAGASGALVASGLASALNGGTVPYLASRIGIIAGPPNSDIAFVDVQIDDGNLAPLPDITGGA